MRAKFSRSAELTMESEGQPSAGWQAQLSLTARLHYRSIRMGSIQLDPVRSKECVCTTPLKRKRYSFNYVNTPHYGCGFDVTFHLTI